MKLVTASAFLVVIVAAWVAGLNFWTYALRRSDRLHLWLGVAALGGVAVSLPGALIHESQTTHEAVVYRAAMAFGAIPFFLGMMRFSEIFLDISLRRVERISVVGILLTCIASVIPGVAFERTPVVRHVIGFGSEYVDVATGPLMSVVGAGFFVLVAYLGAKYRHAEFEEPGEWVPLAAAGLVFVFVAAHDSMVGAGMIAAPFLMGIGITSFVLALTALLSRRFVRSEVRAREAADALQAAAEERTHALRQKDLQLARGEALATVGTLAAGLAHEINNPIAFVSANLNHLGELGHEEEGEAEFAEVLAETREGIDRIRSIVDELTRLARRGEGETEDVDLSRVVRSVLPIVRHEARGRAEIEMLLEDVPPVRGDRQLLGQVVLNLVLNAIHAVDGDAGGTGRVVIATTVERPFVQLHIKDSGPGIAPDVLPHIFEPFFTTKGEGQGTGLGLAITRQLVERHGGEIGVETGEAGTRMTIELPIARSARRGRAPLRSALAPR